jgi:glutaredoxin-like YruB-family protein
MNTNLISLKKEIVTNREVWLLLYKKGSAQSDCAYDNFIQAVNIVRSDGIEKDGNDTFLYADVNIIRDIHPEYKVTSVPALLHFESGRLKNIIKGCHDAAQFYTIFEKAKYVDIRSNTSAQKNVTVFTSPTCTWCAAVKRHFQEHGIYYREIDISKDTKAADELVRRSGQLGVPQTDINGEIIVGFDKTRINSLLGIN